MVSSGMSRRKLSWGLMWGRRFWAASEHTLIAVATAAVPHSLRISHVLYHGFKLSSADLNLDLLPIPLVPSHDVHSVWEPPIPGLDHKISAGRINSSLDLNSVCTPPILSLALNSVWASLIPLISTLSGTQWSQPYCKLNSIWDPPTHSFNLYSVWDPPIPSHDLDWVCNPPIPGFDLHSVWDPRIPDLDSLWHAPNPTLFLTPCGTHLDWVPKSSGFITITPTRWTQLNDTNINRTWKTIERAQMFSVLSVRQCAL